MLPGHACSISHRRSQQVPSKIFISHANSDTDIATALVRTLESSFGISRDEITCMGVSGCRQPTIGSLSNALKLDLRSCQMLFAILTEKSVGSSWVLAEIGAAWIQDKPIVPILCRGLREDQVPPSLRQELFINGDQADIRSKIISALDEVSNLMEMSDHHPRHIDALIKRIRHRRDEVRDKSLEHYQVGRFIANVFVELLDGGDAGFKRGSLRFKYRHKWEHLPKPVQEKQELWIREQQRDARVKKHDFFNGPAIRLHSLHPNTQQTTPGPEGKNPIIELRPSCWYDYAASNKQIDQKVFVPGKGMVSIRSEYADFSRLLSTRNVNWVRLSNILTISIVLVVRDPNSKKGKWTLLGQRTDRVDNARGLLSASAAENMHRWLDEPSIIGDFWSKPKWLTEGKRARSVRKNSEAIVDFAYEPVTCPNPFFTVIRAVHEEISRDIARGITEDDITFLTVAWDIGGFNPHLYASVTIDCPIKDVKRLIRGGRRADTEATILPIRFEPAGELERYLADAQWAEISKGAVLRALVHEYGHDEVDRAFQ